MKSEKLVTIDYAPYRTEEEKLKIIENMKGLIIDEGAAIVNYIIKRV